MLLLLVFFPFAASFLSLNNLSHLTLDGLVTIVFLERSHFLFERLKLLSQPLRVFLFRLLFAYLTNGVLYLSVAFSKQFFRLFLGFSQHVLSVFFQLSHRFLILADDALKFLFAQMDVLSLVFPIALVTNDVLKIFVALDIFRPDDVRSVFDDLFRNANLSGYLDGERTSWFSDFKLEQGAHLVSIVEHGAVRDTILNISVLLKVLVVGRYHGKDFFQAELLQYTFRYSRSDARLGATAKLVNQQERATVAALEHVFHVEQMAGIGTQVVFDILFIANVNHNLIEHARL